VNKRVANLVEFDSVPAFVNLVESDSVPAFVNLVESDSVPAFVNLVESVSVPALVNLDRTGCRQILARSRAIGPGTTKFSTTSLT
jgi:hypothetical protein